MSVPEDTTNGQAVADAERVAPAPLPPGKMRVTHRRNPANRFTIIATALFRDPEMPPNALKIYGNIRGHKEGFDFDANLIMLQTGIKRDGFQAAMRWLEAKGLLTRYQVRMPDGRMGGWYIETSDEPGMFESCTSEPVPDDPAPAVTSNSSTPATGTGSAGTGADQQLSEGDQVAPLQDQPVPDDPHLKKNTPQGDQEREKEEQEDQEQTQPPAVPGARRAVTQVGGALNGGYAAPDMTPAQRSRYRKEVRALFGAVLPAAFLGSLPSNLPNVLPDTFAAAVDDRGVEVIKERVMRRWTRRDSDGYAGTLTRPIPVAVWLVGRTRCTYVDCATPHCPDPQCEDGVIIGMDKPCARCAEHRAEHRAARDAAAPPPIPVASAPPMPPPAAAAEEPPDPPAADPPAPPPAADPTSGQNAAVPPARTAPDDDDTPGVTPDFSSRREFMAKLREESKAANVDGWRAARDALRKRAA